MASSPPGWSVFAPVEPAGALPAESNRLWRALAANPAEHRIVLQTSPDIGMFSVNAYSVDATQPVQSYSLQDCGAVTPLFDMAILPGGALFYGYDCGGGLVQSGYAGGTILAGSVGTPLISLAMMPDGTALAIGTGGTRYQGTWGCRMDRPGCTTSPEADTNSAR